LSICIENLQRSVLQNPFFQKVGFEMFKLDNDELVLKLSIKREHHNVNSTLHGGVHAAIMDSVQNLVLRAAYNTNVSIMNQNVQYLSAVSVGDIYAKARILQKGYKVAMIEAEIIGDKQCLIAKGTGVYKILRATS
jgi:uncharacterized protein (TIGR00369 family)